MNYMTEQIVEILLVEDNPHDVKLTLHAFRKNNIANHTQVVRDGAEALDYLFCEGIYKTRPCSLPRIVMLDLKLPKVDGLEVLRRMKNDPRTQAIPVVMLTSSREERDIIESYQLGVNSYIVKPVDFEQFNQAVRNIGMYWLLLNEPPVIPQ
jgi:two-component system response regulator